MKIKELIFSYLFFVKGIYRKKKDANENGYFLAFFLFFLNLHSSLVLFDVYSKSIDFISFWKTGNENKGWYGYILGVILCLLILILINRFKRRTKLVDRYKIYRKSIKHISKFFLYFYLTCSVFLFFMSLFILAKYLAN